MGRVMNNPRNLYPGDSLIAMRDASVGKLRIKKSDIARVIGSIDGGYVIRIRRSRADLAVSYADLRQVFNAVGYDGPEALPNPAFLPKSLFDRYIIKSSDGSITADKIQTLGGAERKVKELARKFPCLGWEIRSEKHGSVIKSYQASAGRGGPKVDVDNSREFKQSATREAKENEKFVLYVDGQEFATYDTKAEAEKAGKKETGRAGSWRVKRVMRNPRIGGVPPKIKEHISLGRLQEALAKYPADRTAYKAGRGVFAEFAIAVWPNREEMAGFIRNSERGEGPYYKPVIKLETTEGYARRNPSPSDRSDASALYETFHGSPSDGEFDYVENIEVPDTFAGLGDLVELWVIPINGRSNKSVKITAPDPDRNDLHKVVKLASNSEGTQLYFLGGSQDLDLKALGFSGDEIKPHTVVGVLTEITYLTAKKFHRFVPTQYFHKLGEETGVEPMLCYDPVNKQMSIVGGAYRVKDVGIVN